MKYVVGKMPLVVMKFVGAKYGNKNVKIILVEKCPYVVMKFVGAKYGNKNVKIISVEKCPYVVMKFVGGKSEPRTMPQGSPLLYGLFPKEGLMVFHDYRYVHCLLLLFSCASG